MSLSAFKAVTQRKNQDVHYFTITEAFTETINIKWQINNFNDLIDEDGFAINSPVYSSKINQKLRWRLQFYPSTCYIFLNYLGTEKSITASGIYLALINKHNEECMKTYVIEQKFDTKDLKLWGRANFETRSQLVDEEILNNGALIIICKIYINLDGADVNQTTMYSSPQNSNKILFEEEMKANVTALNNLSLVNIFEKDMFSDIKLILKEKTFNAHKIILSCASPIFMEMCKDLKGNNSSIDIKDIPAKIMQEMLRYIYTGKIENLSDIAYELVAAAHKYAIEGLKQECEKSLCAYLTLDNLLDILILAELYDLSQLYTNICNLFIDHKNEIVSTAKYQEMAISNATIVLRLFTSLVRDKKM